MKNLFKKKRKWQINLRKIGDYRGVEITDHTPRWKDIPLLYSDVINYIFKDTENIVLSQISYEHKGYKNVKVEYQEELSNRYSLKVVNTTDYSSRNHPTPESREFVINIAGKPNIEWLNKVLEFGGVSLPNIIYGIRTIDDNWLDETVKRNQIFTKWFNLKLGDDAIIGLRDNVASLFWTSDSHLCILTVENYLSDLMRYIGELATKYSLILDVQENH